MTSSEISVFPNPVESLMEIKLNHVDDVKSMLVTDLNGRIVISSNTFVEKLDTSILQSGMYILSIGTNTGVLTKKILKK